MRPEEIARTDESLGREPSPEVNLLLAVVARAILDWHEWKTFKQIGRGRKWEEYFWQKHCERVDVLRQWAFCDEAIPINLVWIAHHVARGSPEAFIESARRAMLADGYKPDPRAFSFRRTYNQEKPWKEKIGPRHSRSSRRQKRLACI